MTYEIAIVVTNDFNAMGTTAFIDPLRAANYLDNETLYHWELFSSDGGLLRASNGMMIDTRPIPDIDEKCLDLAVISSSWTPEQHYDDATLIKSIKRWGRRGIPLCAIDTGAFILAHAGQLKNHSATTHYEHLDSLMEVNPQVTASDNLFVMDGNILSTSGGTASIDLALHIIGAQHGYALTNAAARYIFHHRIHTTHERQNHPAHEPLGNTPSQGIRDAILLMEENLETPLSVPDIAARVGISQRHLTRLFQRYTRQSAVQYYRDMRLDRGRAFVTQTEMSVIEIAMACGFSSVEHFSRAYRRRFRISPREDRVAGRVPFQFRALPLQSSR